MLPNRSSIDELDEKKDLIKPERAPGEPTMAFQGAAWAALILGMGANFICIRREDSHFNEAKRSKWEMNRLNYILLKII